MLAMYTRRLALPGRSFLLLGPRGTGKTTWLRERLPRARWYNLLLDRELLRLMRDPRGLGPAGRGRAARGGRAAAPPGPPPRRGGGARGGRPLCSPRAPCRWCAARAAAPSASTCS